MSLPTNPNDDIRKLNPALYPPPDAISSTATKSERDLHNRIIDFCRSKGWIYLHGSMAFATARTVGEPDFTILADRRRVFFIECKTEMGKLSLAQQSLHAWAKKLGHDIHTVRSFDDFLTAVEENPLTQQDVL